MAAIVDMRGQLNIRQWEETASAAMRRLVYRLRKPLFSFGITAYQTSRQQTFGDRIVVSPETTHLA